MRSWIVLCRAYNLMLLLNAHPRYTGPWHLHNFSHFTFHEVTTCRPGQMPASDWSILTHHWPLIGRHWLSCDPWWQVAARRRMVVSDSDSSGVTLATSEPLTSGWGHKLAPMLWWSVPEPVMVLACWSVITGTRGRDVKDTLCGDGDSCGISSRPSRLNFETVSLQSPRHCCIQKIYITIRRTIWGNKFKRKLCPRILQFSGTTSVWEKENWDVNFVPTSFPWYCDKILPIINNRMERKLVTLFISFWTFMHARVLKHKRIMCMR